MSSVVQSGQKFIKKRTHCLKEVNESYESGEKNLFKLQGIVIKLNTYAKIKLIKYKKL